MKPKVDAPTPHRSGCPVEKPMPVPIPNTPEKVTRVLVNASPKTR